MNENSTHIEIIRAPNRKLFTLKMSDIKKCTENYFLIFYCYSWQENCPENYILVFCWFSWQENYTENYFLVFSLVFYVWYAESKWFHIWISDLSLVCTFSVCNKETWIASHLWSKSAFPQGIFTQFHPDRSYRPWVVAEQ